MIYDANTWVGHWPFRSLPKRSAADLLKEMDKHGIAKALVGSLHGLLYKDAHEANHELVAEIKRRRDRLVPCAVLNPTYQGWHADLKQCREEFGMPVLRMFPDYHGYSLKDPCAAEMVEAAHALKMTVAFYFRVVDPRGRHLLDPGREVNAEDLTAFVRRWPKAKFLMLNFRNMMNGTRMDAPACYYDLTHFMGASGLNMERYIKQYGADRFVFGTTMLMRPGMAAALALEKCSLTKKDRDAIQWKNLVKLVPELK